MKKISPAPVVRFQRNLQGLLVIAFVTISVVFYGFFSLIVKNLSYYLSELSERVEIVAFIDDKLNVHQKNELIKKIENIKIIDKIKYTSKTEAMDEFRKNPEFAKQMEILGENPLPATVDIYLKRKDPEIVKKIAEEIKILSGVEDIYYTSIEAENLLTINKTFNTLIGWLNLIFAIFVVISVVSLSLAVSAMRDKKIFFGMIDAIIGGGIGFYILYLMNEHIFVQNFKTPVFFSKSEIIISSIVLMIICLVVRIKKAGDRG
ncbi:MAG: permease-like cell division protein FtsX [Elusimicrobiota bacterium]